MVTTGRPVTLAIVGAGSRGLGIVERLIGHCLAAPFPVTVHLVDPKPLGPGFHRPDQPDHLLLNTVCAQVTAFADERMVDGPVGVRGPSLHEWCQARRLRVGADGYTVRAGAGREIQPSDFLPRRLLSEYLTWAAERIVAGAPPGFELVRHAATATDIRPAGGRATGAGAGNGAGAGAGAGAGNGEGSGDDGGEVVVLDDGTRVAADAVFVTVGHQALHLPDDPAGAGAGPGLIGRPYPLPEALDTIAPGDTVAVLGMGLTAMDVIASLTLGRGGRHEPGPDGELRYVPGGREPRIVLANRSGLPSRSRPHLNPGRVRHAPLVLTPDLFRALRRAREGGRLRFATDVLPLIETEMELAYHRALLARRTGDPVTAGAELARRVAELGSERTLAAARAEHGPWPLRGVLTERLTDRPWRDTGEYAGWYAAQVRADLAEARAGLGASPVKEALEVLRDHREALRSVIDPPGVDDASLEYFFGEFTPAVNRLVIGPQLDRSAELLSLLAAGVLRLGPGPRPEVVAPAGPGPWRLVSTCLARPETVEVDHVVRAHLAEPDPGRLPASLLGRLVAAGRVTTLAGSGRRVPGLRVTRAGQGVGPGGEVRRTLFFLGPHTEGSSYYNHYVPSPGAPSRALRDAELALRTALSDLAIPFGPSDRADRAAMPVLTDLTDLSGLSGTPTPTLSARTVRTS
ncbi:FAD/NAD(P)-binding protein [Streptomyces sp. LP05-1]|uniref:FAD/NAD(P)-binding protein n=1 Tax=Streptomyces pyxinae TaxID=2970734 RepID=A0ABT2CLI3_9ACTN|nr:FAD/NAD(P)-binding protein [Streptomyces sp. LP05-1]MCS0638175.1 FAD/NAD(P)-binding protein [Streptomyces sp. LP05-1]